MSTFNPKEVLALCPFCWKEPCDCIVWNPIEMPKQCKDCAEKDKEIEKLKNLLALAGVGY